eukprot:5842767-Pyramimonas_sp.AAC.1
MHARWKVCGTSPKLRARPGLNLMLAWARRTYIQPSRRFSLPRNVHGCAGPFCSTLNWGDT